MSIGVIITDDHQIVLDSLSMHFSTLPDMEVVGTLNDSRKVMGFLETHEVDILVTDLSMPYLTGVALTLQVRDKFPDLKYAVRHKLV